MHPLRKLDELDEQLNKGSGYTGVHRWMLPYADFLTLLLGFFVVLFAASAIEKEKADDTLPPQTAGQAAPLVLIADQTTMDNANLNQLQKSITGVGAQTQITDPDNVVQAIQGSIIQQLGLTDEQVTVHQDTRGVVISFEDKIFFPPGEAVLSPKAKQTVDKLAKILAKTDRPIRVEGHTDNTPIKTAKYPSNWELSTARSTTIVRYLTETYHFPPRRISAAGFSEFQPIADNSTKEGKQKNRRVDIVLLNPMPQSGPQEEAHQAKPPKLTPSKHPQPEDMPSHG